MVPIIKEKHPDVMFFVSKWNCGWGSGLWRLFCQACTFIIESGIEFEYLMNMDYDLIFTKKGADVTYIKDFTSPAIGQVGKYNPKSAHWARKVKNYLPRMHSIFAKLGKSIPKDYIPGQHNAGAFTLMKENCILQLYRDGYFKSPFVDIGDQIKLADDPMLSLFVMMAGYKLAAMSNTHYIVWQMAEDYRKIPERDLYVYHPTKLVPGNGRWSLDDELQCRNFFRAIRNQEPIPIIPSLQGVGRATDILV